MKLNLLPTTVRKGAKSRTAVVVSTLMFLGGIGASVFLVTSSSAALLAAKQAVADERPKADQAVAVANQADTVIATAAGVVRNTELAKAMIAHNDKYPSLYDSVLKYVPSFYRITSISAAAGGEGTSTITLTGTLDSYQQYADLMFALLRFPGAQSISRQGFVGRAKEVPAITVSDQVGRPRLPNELPIPDDPVERLTYFESNATGDEGYTGTGNFGTGNTDTRFAGPDSSLVTVTLVVNRDLRVPDVRGTLAGAGGGATSSAASASPASFGMPPSAGAPPSGRLGGGGGGKGGSEED